MCPSFNLGVLFRNPCSFQGTVSHPTWCALTACNQRASVLSNKGEDLGRRKIMEKKWWKTGEIATVGNQNEMNDLSNRTGVCWTKSQGWFVGNNDLFVFVSLSPSVFAFSLVEYHGCPLLLWPCHSSSSCPQVFLPVYFASFLISLFPSFFTWAFLPRIVTSLICHLSLSLSISLSLSLYLVSWRSPSHASYYPIHLYVTE